MNIFVLDEDPFLAAQYMCNKHVVKMIVESCQLMSTAHHVCDGQLITRTAKNGRTFKTYEKDSQKTELLRCTMINHPCTIWTRSSNLAYHWLWYHTYELLQQYNDRYNKIHKYSKLVKGCLAKTPSNIPVCKRPPFAQAMPDSYKDNDAIKAYRNYYIFEKSRFAKWPDGKTPKWYLDGIQNNSIISV